MLYLLQFINRANGEYLSEVKSVESALMTSPFGSVHSKLWNTIFIIFHIYFCFTFIECLNALVVEFDFLVLCVENNNTRHLQFIARLHSVVSAIEATAWHLSQHVGGTISHQVPLYGQQIGTCGLALT
jgi:hypothetical protein